MNYTPVTGWFYINANDRTASWTSVKYFHRFMTSNEGAGPFAIDTDRKNIIKGDVIQLGRANGEFYHTLFVLEKTPDDIFIAANSNDALYRPLSSYSYEQVRYLHIIAARAEK